ncbi:hypothetical protein HYPDE_33303 [Hyphomicrobium denitrificans 1NES1]|uniref:Uncharacterized protein n=1 Tax=Hyphomicrobium denitrificans 1NES1 TaxID=670307 RepID=N0B5N0_9HYPH|nr:hypothetical protein HYPDE_33303 [Hyphomicrobium denitrificans 1NES1]
MIRERADSEQTQDITRLDSAHDSRRAFGARFHANHFRGFAAGLVVGVGSDHIEAATNDVSSFRRWFFSPWRGQLVSMTHT